MAPILTSNSSDHAPMVGSYATTAGVLSLPVLFFMMIVLTFGHRTIMRYGESGEGQAKLIERNSNGQLLVVKTIMQTEGPRSGTKRWTPNEVKTLKRLFQAPHNIIKLEKYAFATAADSTPICRLYLQHCNGGDLSDLYYHLQQRGTVAPAMFVLHFVASMADALAYLHLGLLPSTPTDNSPPSFSATTLPTPTHKPLLHCDIKLENILLRWPTSDTSPSAGGGLPTIVLADFGYACPAHTTSGYCGTPARSTSASAAPIMTPASDIYCFGAVLYTLATGRWFCNLYPRDSVAASAPGGSSSAPVNLSTLPSPHGTIDSNTYNPDNLPFHPAPPTLTHDFEHFSDLGPALPGLLLLTRCALAESPTQRVSTGELFDLGRMLKGILKRWVDDGGVVERGVFPGLQGEGGGGGGGVRDLGVGEVSGRLSSRDSEKGGVVSAASSSSSSFVVEVPSSDDSEADVFPSLVAESRPVSAPPTEILSTSSTTTTETTEQGDKRLNSHHMSLISGFEDDFCFCPNHAPLSHRWRKPGCPGYENGEGEEDGRSRESVG
ncbi:hypothetical protein KC356_g5604 [Hortaea werneckii]|nr:hypothetical protein KC356_g5604 [Hortaea werneckii]